MVATFWPTVGIVFPAVDDGGASPVAPRVGSLDEDEEVALKMALIWFMKVVFPALSKPSKMMEYSKKTVH